MERGFMGDSSPPRMGIVRMIQKVVFKVTKRTDTSTLVQSPLERSIPRRELPNKEASKILCGSHQWRTYAPQMNQIQAKEIQSRVYLSLQRSKTFPPIQRRHARQGQSIRQPTTRYATDLWSGNFNYIPRWLESGGHLYPPLLPPHIRAFCLSRGKHTETTSRAVQRNQKGREAMGHEGWGLLTLV